MTDRQYYRGLNRRFEKRASLLRRFGYRYVVHQWKQFDHGMQPSTAVFVRTKYGKGKAIPATFVMHADQRCWRYELTQALQSY